jgi:AraC-like DNA-binding protein
MPHPELAPYVRGYQGYFETSSLPVRRRELPSGEVALIISLGPDYELIDPQSGSPLYTLSSFVAGLDDTFSMVDSTGTGLAIQVDFTPIGARRLLQLPLQLVSHRTTGITDLWGTQADRLLEQLFETRDWGNRFAVLDEFLLARIRRSVGVPPEVVWAWRQLEHSAGGVPVQQIADSLAWSRKRLIRAFRSYIGVPPKTLGRLLRFRRALRELSSQLRVSYGEVVVKCRYSDQAHLIREFKEFSGLTPGELLNSYSPNAGVIEVEKRE